MVLKTTFGQPQRWSLIRGTMCEENEEKYNFNFTNKVFNGHDVLILGGLNSGISLYFKLISLTLGLSERNDAQLLNRYCLSLFRATVLTDLVITNQRC